MAGVLEGEVQRVMCTRDIVPAAKSAAEERIDAGFDRLRQWKNEFEKRAGRPVTQADLLLADESLRKTARRLGLL